MKIHDEGIIVGLKKYGERGVILNIFSQNNGLIRGYSRASRKRQYSLILDLVSFEWKSKTDDGLGYIKFEVLDTFFKNDENYICLLLKMSASELCLKLIPIKENNKIIFNDFKNFIKSLNYFEFSEKKFLEEYIFWELKLLNNIGFGLDFSKCAVSGEKENLSYVSPNTGQVVSKFIGEPWKDKLLILPKFYWDHKEKVGREDIKNGLILNYFFINKVIKTLSYNKSTKLIYRNELQKKFTTLYS